MTQRNGFQRKATAMGKDNGAGDPITQVIYRTFADLHPWGPDLPYSFSEYVERIAPVAALAVLNAMGQEERFVPVAESGERWEPQPQTAASRQTHVGP